MEARPSETSGVRGLNKTYLWDWLPVLRARARWRKKGKKEGTSALPIFSLDKAHLEKLKGNGDCRGLEGARVVVLYAESPA